MGVGCVIMWISLYCDSNVVRSEIFPVLLRNLSGFGITHQKICQIDPENVILLSSVYIYTYRKPVFLYVDET